MTRAGIGTTKNVEDPLTLADEELLWSSSMHYWLLNDTHYISGGRVCAWEC
jgi:hypothetical protein